MQSKQRLLANLALCSGLTAAGCAAPDAADPAGDEAVAAQGAASTIAVESCRGEPDVDLAVARWPGVPAEGDVAELSTTGLALALDNLESRPLVVKRTGVMVAGGQRVELALGAGTVAAGGTLATSVPLAGFGVDIADLAFSGSVFVEFELRDASGALVRRAFSPTRFFHGAGGGAVVYGAEAKRARFNGGDLRGQIVRNPGPEIAGVADGGTGAGQLDDGGPADLSAGNPTAGPGTWEFCPRWLYQSVDSGFELPGGITEDYYTSGRLMKARGMKIRVEHPNWGNVPKEGFANQNNGCFTFRAAENSGFVVTLFAEARLGTNQNLTLKGFQDGAAKAANQITQWKVLLSPGGLPRRVYLQTESGDITNLMAFGSFSAFWVDSHTTPGLPGPSSLSFVGQAFNHPNCTEACKAGDALWFKPGSVTREKFGVAHEVGHWLHAQWTVAGPGPGGDPYAVSGSPALEPLCAYNTPGDGPGGHALRSREHAHGAYTEGVGHFIAALAWNDPDQTEGVFKYYKDSISSSSYDDMKNTAYVVSLEGAGAAPLGGPSDWFHQHCQVSAGQAVEIDWLRFLWDYRTNDPAEIDQSVPTNHDVFSLMQFTKANHGWASLGGVHSAYVAAFNNPALPQPAWFKPRWLTLAAQNGVAQ